MRALLRHLALFVGYGAVCSLATLIVVYVHHLQSQPDLARGHTAKLDAAFRAADAASVRTLDDYRGLEDALSVQLQAEVYEKVAIADRRALDRYSAGSRSDPLPHQPATGSPSASRRSSRRSAETAW